MPELTLRSGHIGDLNAVFRLNQSVFDEAWSEGSLYAALESGFDLYVCEDGGMLAGYILSQDILDEVHIMQVAVAKACRRRGVATLLSRYLLRCKAGMMKVLLEVRASNQAARGLYAGLGFHENGLRKGYYSADVHGRREDAVLMVLTLHASGVTRPDR